MFCTFRTNYAGLCGKVEVLNERCARHLGLINKQKIERTKRYSGRSKWAEENGLFVKSSAHQNNESQS